MPTPLPAQFARRFRRRSFLLGAGAGVLLGAVLSGLVLACWPARPKGPASGAAGLPTEFIPPNAFAVWVAHPRRILAHPDMPPLSDDRLPPQLAELGIDARKLDQVVFVVATNAEPQGEGLGGLASFLTVLRFAEPVDGRALLQRLLGAGELASAEHQGRAYFRRPPPPTDKGGKGRPPEQAGLVANERTVVFGPEPLLREALASRGPSPALGDLLRQAPLDHDLVGVMAPGSLREPLARALAQGQAGAEETWLLQAAEQLDSVLVTADLFRSPQLRLQCKAVDARAAAGAEQVLHRLLLKLEKASDRPVLSPFDSILSQVSDEITHGTDFVRQGDRLEVSVRLLTPRLLGRFTEQALGKFRDEGEAARGYQRENSLRMLGLAFNIYHDAHRSYPRPASLGPDGKPLLSWRVQLLPYLGPEEKALARQFRYDEPWDSEHNKALLAKMPAVYRTSRRPEDADKTGCLLCLGPLSPFATPEGPSQVLRLGRSYRTVLLVEAAALVPWTKPADLEVDMDSPLAGLGAGKEVRAVMFDGSTRRFDRKADADRLGQVLTFTGDGGPAGPLSPIPFGPSLVPLPKSDIGKKPFLSPPPPRDVPFPKFPPEEKAKEREKVDKIDLPREPSFRDVQQRKDDLRALGLAYRLYHTTFDKGPARAQDLAPYFSSPRLTAKLTSGAIVFHYGVAPRQMPIGRAVTVLAYEREVPAAGGYVLMGDGAVRYMAAAEFQTLSRAGRLAGIPPLPVKKKD